MSGKIGLSNESFESVVSCLDKKTYDYFTGKLRKHWFEVEV